MALLDKDERRILIGVGIGVVAAGVLRGLASSLSGVGRPLAKAGIKSGLTLYEKGKEKVAQLGEVFEDLVAEAKSELDAEARQAVAGTPPGSPKTGPVQ